MPISRKDRDFWFPSFNRVGAFLPSLISVVSFLVSVSFFVSCSVTRHVPEDDDVLSRVYINVDGRPSSNSTLQMAVVQKAYHRTFGFLPVGAWIWHNDSTTAWHRFRARLGTKPPVYDEALSERTVSNMRRALVNQGFLDAKVTYDTESRNRKVAVTYSVDKGRPHRIRKVECLVEDPLLEELIRKEMSNTILQKGVNLDRTMMETERTRLTSQMRDLGFYDFNKDDISFIADTVSGDKRVDLTMLVGGIHNRYTIRSVEFVPDYDLATGQRTGHADYLRASIMAENCYIQPGALYSETSVRKTYSAFSRLHILKYVNIRLEPTDQPDELACTVYLSPQNPQSLQFELDGTNTAGDLGFAASMTYQHRNLFRGSEAYSATLKGGYESLSGDLTGLVNHNYTEYSFENQIDFPRFLFPFMSAERRRLFTATTAVKAGYNFQSRPEYTRIITNAGFVYKWNDSRRRFYHTLDVVDLSYVNIQKISDSFNSIIQNSPNTAVQFRSHLILSSAYNLYAGTGRTMMNSRPTTTRDLWTLRVSPEIAGNILYSFSQMARLDKSDGQYQLFDLPFEQYALLDVDWAYSKYLTDRSRLAFHLAGGVAVPYANSPVMPFEKRYYAGGANSVRGWNVRNLGPGRYRGSNSSRWDANQCGDIRMDASVELRSRLFWKFEFAAFIDAGNVWTLEPYDAQPQGEITSEFYKEIAASWGLGLRLVTDFVVLRLDLGIKAHDPSLGSGSDAWVITDPLSHNNRTFHFAVGYPF